MEHVLRQCLIALRLAERIGLDEEARAVDDMIAHHAAMARMLGEQLQLPAEVLDALSAAYEQWDGRGWPNGVEAEAVPLASRVSQISEFVEVAYRVGGPEAARELART